jgi:hypothetical protein
MSIDLRSLCQQVLASCFADRIHICRLFLSNSGEPVDYTVSTRKASVYITHATLNLSTSLFPTPLSATDLCILLR